MSGISPLPTWFCALVDMHIHATFFRLLCDEGEVLVFGQKSSGVRYVRVVRCTRWHHENSLLCSSFVFFVVLFCPFLLVHVFSHVSPYLFSCWGARRRQRKGKKEEIKSVKGKIGNGKGTIYFVLICGQKKKTPQKGAVSQQTGSRPLRLRSISCSFF